MKVGDLVYVAKPTPCCGNTKYLGVPAEVDEIYKAESHCSFCGHIFGNVTRIMLGRKAFISEMLRVIPPLNELEAEKAVETVNA